MPSCVASSWFCSHLNSPFYALLRPAQYPLDESTRIRVLELRLCRHRDRAPGPAATTLELRRQARCRPRITRIFGRNLAKTRPDDTLADPVTRGTCGGLGKVQP